MIQKKFVHKAELRNINAMQDPRTNLLCCWPFRASSNLMLPHDNNSSGRRYEIGGEEEEGAVISSELYSELGTVEAADPVEIEAHLSPSSSPCSLS